MNYVAPYISFPFAMWLLSRLIILCAMLFVAPLIPSPPNGVAAKFGWDVFSAWDSQWYHLITENGYEFSLEKKQNSVAFFPLFPLLTRGLMSFGIPFHISGTLINNFAFLAALIILYLWVAERYDKSTAQWATAILAWCPYSIYGTVIYTEGLFLLCSTSALRAFDKKQYAWVGLWGALATATRVTGMALVPAFLLTSWLQKRTLKAFISSLAVGSGLFLYCLYCQLKFNDALAFLHAQKGWRSSYGFDWQGWGKILMEIVVGPANAGSGYIKDFWYPLGFATIIGCAYLLWLYRQKLGSVKVRYGFYCLWFLLWIIAGDSLIKIILIFGGLILLCFSIKKIPLAAVIYGFCSYAIVLNTGLTASVERYVYAIVPLSYACGLLLARYPRWGYLVISFCVIPLFSFSIRFCQKLWLA
ncbi:MAG: mannosyltransferase family protein [Scytonema sp. PMC 1070.18]|nr:mannosyltransferase family protein [Scytonema sp. PMC 1070.18]